MHARGIEHQSKGVENCLAVINLALATGNIGREGAGCTMITGQGNGQGGREHGQKCDQLPGQRSTHRSRQRASTSRASGASRPKSFRSPATPPQEIMNAIHRGEIKGLLSICFNPLVSLPDANFTREALAKLEFFGVIDFFLSETAHYADVVLAGSLQEEEEGVVCNVEGRVIHIAEGGRSARRRAAGLGRSSATSPSAWARGQYFPFTDPARDLRRTARRLARRRRRLLRHHLRERSIEQMGVFWPCPSLDHPGTPRLFEDGKFFHPDGKAHFNVTEWRDSGDPVDDEYPDLSDHRPRGQPVSLRHADPPHRRAGGSVSRAAGWRSIRAWPSSTASRTAIG